MKALTFLSCWMSYELIWSLRNKDKLLERSPVREVMYPSPCSVGARLVHSWRRKMDYPLLLQPILLRNIYLRPCGFIAIISRVLRRLIGHT